MVAQMKWPWSKTTRPSDEISRPRMTLKAQVISQDVHPISAFGSRFEVTISIVGADSDVRLTVPHEVARRLPVGQRLRLVIERDQ